MKTQWSVKSDLESLAWHSKDDRLFVATLENGQIQCFDIRKPKKVLWAVQGDKEPVTSLSFNADKPELFATSSLSGRIKLWTQESVQSEPKMLYSRRSEETGAVFNIAFAPRRLLPSMLVIGATEDFGIWDVRSEEKVMDWWTTRKTDGENKGRYRIEKRKQREREFKDIQKKYEHRIMEQTFQYGQGHTVNVDDEQPSDDEQHGNNMETQALANYLQHGDPSAGNRSGSDEEEEDHLSFVESEEDDGIQRKKRIEQDDDDLSDFSDIAEVDQFLSM